MLPDERPKLVRWSYQRMSTYSQNKELNIKSKLLMRGLVAVFIVLTAASLTDLLVALALAGVIGVLAAGGV